jgi:hypothetical protein
MIAYRYVLLCLLILTLCLSLLKCGEAPRLSAIDTALIEHRDALRLEKEFTADIQRPFVVISDMDPATERKRALHLVRWAADLLEKDFFAAPPDAIYDLWLLKDAASYNSTVTKMTGEAPTTIYGFCSDSTKTIYLNYATGGGTLIHEITHAYMHGNFPACPAWFNEGLASLFEAVKEHDGHLYGLPNWRLNGLQQALKAGTAPSFASIMAMTPGRFYGDGRDVNYGVARYLCYQLQERHLLIPYFRAFVANQKNDPEGIASLKQVLNVSDLTAFRAEWETAMMALKIPER